MTDPDVRPNERPEAANKYFRWGGRYGDYEFSLQKIQKDSPFLLAVDHVSHEQPVIWLELNDHHVWGLWMKAFQHLVSRRYDNDGPEDIMTDENVLKMLAWCREQRDKPGTEEG